MSVSLQEIGDHLDMSERNARDVLKALKIDWREATLDDVRVAYIRDIREKAAGRYGATGEGLAEAKTREAMASTELKLLQIEEKSGRLVPMDGVEQALRAMVVAARAEFLTMPEKLRVEIQALHGIDIDVDLIQTHVEQALSHLARTGGAELSPDEAPRSEGVGAAA